MIGAEAWWTWLIIGPVLGLAVLGLALTAGAWGVFVLSAIAAVWEIVRGGARMTGLPIRDEPSRLWRWVDGL